MPLDVELPRAEIASPHVTPFEFDVQEVLGLLGNSETADSNLDESPDFGLECAVETVQPAEQAAVELAECPVCGNQWARPRFTISGTSFRVVDCTQCGLGRLYPQPRRETIDSFYPPSYYGVTGAKFVPLVEALVRIVGARHVRMLSRGLTRRRTGARRGLRSGCLALGACRSRS